MDADDVLYEATIPYDPRFYEALDRVVQIEPWLQRDRAMIDTLRTSASRRASRSRPTPR